MGFAFVVNGLNLRCAVWFRCYCLCSVAVCCLVLVSFRLVVCGWYCGWYCGWWLRLRFVLVWAV